MLKMYPFSRATIIKYLTWQLRITNLLFPNKLWRLEVQNQDTGRAMLALKSLENCLFQVFLLASG